MGLGAVGTDNLSLAFANPLTPLPTGSTDLSVSADLQPGANQLFLPQPQAMPTQGQTSGFDMALGDSLAVQEINNHGMPGLAGPQYNANKPADFGAGETAAVGDPPQRILQRLKYLQNQNKDIYQNKNILLHTGSNDPSQIDAIKQSVQFLRDNGAAQVVVPGIGPGVGKYNQDAANRAIQLAVTGAGGVYFMPNLTRGWDREYGVHPNNAGEMIDQATRTLNSMRTDTDAGGAGTTGGAVPMPEVPSTQLPTPTVGFEPNRLMPPFGARQVVGPGGTITGLGQPGQAGYQTYGAPPDRAAAVNFGPEATKQMPEGYYNFAQMYQMAHNAGFRGDAANIAAAIGMAESKGNAGAIAYDDAGPGLHSYGLMQINKTNDRILGDTRGALDPQTSFNMAYKLSKGGTDFRPWTAYTTDDPRRSYQQYMHMAGNPNTALYPGDALAGTGYAVGGRGAIVPPSSIQIPPAMVAGGPGGGGVGSSGGAGSAGAGSPNQAGGPSGGTNPLDPRIQAALDAFKAKANQQQQGRGWQMLALLAGLMKPQTPPKNTYDPKAALVRVDLSNAMPPSRVDTGYAMRKVPGPLYY